MPLSIESYEQLDTTVFWTMTFTMDAISIITLYCHYNPRIITCTVRLCAIGTFNDTVYI